MAIGLKRIMKLILVCVGVYIILGAIVPLLHHRAASPEPAVFSQDTGGERVLSIDDNDEALLWRLRVIEEANEEIILSTLDLRDDESGKIIMGALYEAADRGIDVKLLLDGLNCTFHLAWSDVFKALVSHPNVEAKAYNTLTLARPWVNQFRLHDKYLIADSAAYILGGRNTHDLFLGGFCVTGNIDRDVLVYTETPSDGGSVSQLRAYFDSVWSLPCCEELSYKGDRNSSDTLHSYYERAFKAYPSAFGYGEWVQDTVPARSITLLTNPIMPENKEPQLWQMFMGLIETGSDVIIETPYIVPDKYMSSSLQAACSGRDVKIITNSAATGANIWGCADYMNNKSRILSLGAGIYELAGDSSSHTKSIVIDDNISIVGSFNFDMRSAYLDTELMLVIDSQELNARLRQRAEYSLSKSRLALPDGSYIYGDNCTYPEMSVGKRAFYSLLRLVILPIRHLL